MNTLICLAVSAAAFAAGVKLAAAALRSYMRFTLCGQCKSKIKSKKNQAACSRWWTERLRRWFNGRGTRG